MQQFLIVYPNQDASKGAARISKAHKFFGCNLDAAICMARSQFRIGPYEEKTISEIVASFEAAGFNCAQVEDK